MKNLSIYFLVLLIMSCVSGKKSDKNNTLDIHNIWSLVKMNDKKVTKPIQIEFNTQKRTFYGTDGCNEISGSLKKFSNSEVIFSEILSTRMACPNMELPNNYTKSLQKIRKYKIKNMHLQLVDEDGKVLLVYKKVN